MTGHDASFQVSARRAFAAVASPWIGGVRRSEEASPAEKVRIMAPTNLYQDPPVRVSWLN